VEARSLHLIDNSSPEAKGIQSKPPFRWIHDGKTILGSAQLKTRATHAKAKAKKANKQALMI